MKVQTAVPEWSERLHVRENTFTRHQGQWFDCGEPEQHSEHQICYNPWKACPGRRASVTPERTEP